MMINPLLKAAILAAAVLCAAGSATALEGAAAGRLDDRRMFRSGQDAFAKTCARCHTGREDAVGPNLFLMEYDPDTIKFFARHGQGPMPAFTQSMIDDATLDELAAYVAEQGKKGAAR